MSNGIGGQKFKGKKIFWQKSVGINLGVKRFWAKVCRVKKYLSKSLLAKVEGKSLWTKIVVCGQIFVCKKLWAHGYLGKVSVGHRPPFTRSGRTECSASEKCRSWRTQPASASLQTMVRDRNHNENPSFPDSLQRTKTHGNKIANTEWSKRAGTLDWKYFPLRKSTSVRTRPNLVCDQST